MNTPLLKNTLELALRLGALTAVMLCGTSVTSSSDEQGAVESRQGTQSRLTREASRYLQDAAEAAQRETVRELVHQVGKMRLVESIPDLVFLLDNEPRGFLARDCIRALGQIGDDRAILPLAGELRWSTSGRGRLEEAVKALDSLGKPIAPFLTRALASDDQLVRRRALQAINLLSRDTIQDTVRRQAQRPRLFRFPGNLKRRLLPLLHDSSSVVRVEALSTYLDLSRHDSTEALAMVADDPNLSVQQIVTGARSKVYGEAWRFDGWLPLRALAAEGSTRREYGVSSQWAPWKGTIEIRVLLSSSELSLPEPTYLLNAPVWIRVELRNVGDDAADITTDGQGIPVAPLTVRDEFGMARAVGANPKISHYSTRPLSLGSGQSIAWDFHFLRECRIWANGSFTLHGDWGTEAPALLSFVVRDMPLHPWRPGKDSRLGLSREVVTYPRQPLPVFPERAPKPTHRNQADRQASRSTSGPLERFVERGDRRALVSMTHHMNVAEISEELLGSESSAARLETAEDRILVEGRRKSRVRYDDLQLAFDAVERAHVVFTEQFVVPVRKYDRTTGQMTRSERRYKTHHVRSEAGQWLDSVELSDTAHALSMPQLLLDGRGAVLVLGLVSRPSPVRASAGLKTRQSDVVLRRLDAEMTWGAFEHCFTIEARIMHGLDAAVDDDGAVHVVWAPWFDNDQRQQLHHRQSTGDGWTAERRLAGLDRNLRRPRVLFSEGLGTLLTTGRTPGNQSTGIFWYDLREKGGSGPHLVADDVGVVWWPSRSPAASPLIGSLPVSVGGNATVFGRSSTGIAQESAVFGLPDMDRWYENVSLATDSEGRPYGLANWHGVVVLFRLAQDGGTEALLVADPTTWRKGAKALGHPELVIRNGQWHALWGEGAESAGRVRYARGVIPEEGWMNPQRLSFLLRPAIGFTVSDLDYIQAAVFSEALRAEEQGKQTDALERYTYLVLNQMALARGGHGSKGEERRFALEKIASLLEQGDRATHAYLWSLVRDKPDALYPTENLWKLLLDSVGPRVQVTE